MAPGARNKFGAHMFKPKVFQGQIYCIEKSTWVIIGTFRRPQWFGAWGIMPPLPPLGTLLSGLHFLTSCNRMTCRRFYQDIKTAFLT